MIAIRVVLDEALNERPSELADYAEQLTAAMVRFAPVGCTVDGFIPSSPESEYERIGAAIPGLGTLHKSSLARRELGAAWQHGFTRIPGRGMVHAPSLLAPLTRHDRLHEQEQIVVTLHDTLAWTHPELLASREVSRQLALGKRAVRFADAVVVPSHTVAVQADEVLGLGERIRVIASATSPAAQLPQNADMRAERLELPERYVLGIDTPSTAAGLQALGSALDAPLLVIEPLADPADMAVVIARAAVLVYPAVEAGFGVTVLDALALGTPVVHSDAAALVELTADASLVVSDNDGLAAAVNEVLRDEALAQRLRYAGEDRAKAFTWRSAAEKVWQLHADL